MTKLKQWQDFPPDTKQNGERICRGLKMSPIRSPVGLRDVTEIGSKFVTMIYLVNEWRRSHPSWPRLRQAVDTLFFWGNLERKIYLNPIFWSFKSSFSLKKSLFLLEYCVCDEWFVLNTRQIRIICAWIEIVLPFLFF